MIQQGHYLRSIAIDGQTTTPLSEPLPIDYVLLFWYLNQSNSNLPQDLRRAKPQVAFCLPNGWCAACLSAKPRIFTRNTLTTDVFFRLFFLR